MFNGNQLKALKDLELLPKNLIFDENFNNQQGYETINAEYNNKTKQITVGKRWLDMFNNPTTRNQAIRKLIHEQLHYKLRKSKEYVRSVQSIYDEFKEYLDNNNVPKDAHIRNYLFENESTQLRALEEFLVESLTSEELAKYLNGIKTSVPTKRGAKNLWQRILLALSDIFGWKVTKGSLYEKELNTIRELKLSSETVEQNIETQTDNNESNVEQEDNNNLQENNNNVQENNKTNEEKIEVQDEETEETDESSDDFVDFSDDLIDEFESSITEQPVEEVVYSKNTSFKEFDKTNSDKNGKISNLGISENKIYTISKVQELYNRFNDDETSKILADKVFNIAKNLGIEVSFIETLPLTIGGTYTNNNTIVYNKPFFEGKWRTSAKASILLHEVIHSVSMYALSNQTENWKRSEALQDFRTEINSIYQDIKNNPIIKNEYGATDVFEFVAELADPSFRDKIKKIDKQNRSLWSWILNAFKSLFGLRTSDTYYKQSMNALDKALNAFDIDSYKMYNRVNHTSKQESNAKKLEFDSISDKELKSEVNDYFNNHAYNEELLSIKKKAIADGTFMKAPNGRPTNLTERQWLKVRTKSFKDWFGDWENDSENASKVVDENGEPLVVYHHRKSELYDFSKRTDNIMPGIYFSKKPLTHFGSYQIQAFLNIKNPIKDYHEDNLFQEDIDSYKKVNIDGKFTTDFEDETDTKILEYVAFDPNQIKSATGNIGAFSKEDDNIYHSSVTEERITLMQNVPSIASISNILPLEQQPEFDALVASAEFETSCR